MAYGLSFSDEFYATAGDTEAGELQLNSRGEPTTLYSAIALLLATPSRDRRRLCLAFKASVATLQDNVWSVVDRAREIDTCESIGRGGVPVHLTRGDWALTVTVYEQDCTCGQPLNHRGFCLEPDTDGKRAAFVDAVAGCA